jgi:perosamine synthetase
MIRLAIPSIEAEDLQAVHDTLATGYLVQGPRVAAFETTVAQYVGAQYAVAVSSGTAALHLALLALGVGPGDLVVTTAYSWPATANVIELCGARPVFVDIRPDTFNLDPIRLQETLIRLMGEPAQASRVKAVLPVHAFGQMADMPEILEIAGRYGLPVVEDAACALGASLKGRQAGAWGIMGCFSFHPRKNITTGEGGMITTNDTVLARTLRALRNHGQDPEAPGPNFIMPGFNYRMTEFQAALGLTQMAKLDRIITARRRMAECYNTLLQGGPLRLPVVTDHASHTYQSYVVLLPEARAGNRPMWMARMRESGIETSIGTHHIPLTQFFRSRYGFQQGDFPVTDMIFKSSFTLPSFEGLLKSQQELIADNILGLLRIFEAGIDVT